jgi:hypothetical protein
MKKEIKASSMPHAVAFDQANFTYTVPKGMEDTVSPLPCYRNKELGCSISCWKFPILERIRFLLTGKLWLYMLTPSHPAISLSIESPFQENKSTPELS